MGNLTKVRKLISSNFHNREIIYNKTVVFIQDILNAHHKDLGKVSYVTFLKIKVFRGKLLLDYENSNKHNFRQSKIRTRNK